MGKLSSTSVASTIPSEKEVSGADYSRFVPISFAFPTDPVDLAKDWVRRVGKKNWQSDERRPAGDWATTKQPSPQAVSAFQQQIAQIRDPDGQDVFLDPTPPLPNPLETFPECARACERLLAAANQGESVLVYGDYDCDGVVSVTLIHDVLRALGLKKEQIFTVIPHRIEDGYGLNWNVVERRIQGIQDIEAKPRLIISVDSGSTAVEAVGEILKQNELDLIIVDHHDPNPERKLPEENPRLIHINPKLWMERPERDARYQMENMCASGLAYLLARAVIRRTRIKAGWSAERALLLAGMATCVDVMKLTGINRALLKHSLRLANTPSRLALVPGLVELKSKLGPHPKTKLRVTETTYGFFWGPAVNAAGRMERADIALNMLLASSPGGAKKWVNKCILLNRWRKATELAMVHEAEQLVEGMGAGPKSPAQSLWKSCQHSGEIGPAGFKWKDGLGYPVIVSPTGVKFPADASRQTASRIPECRVRECEKECRFGCAGYVDANLNNIKRLVSGSVRAASKEAGKRPVPPVLVLSKPDWHPGVVGIVAARIKEKYGRPTLVSSVHPIPTQQNPHGVVWRGSARSLKNTVKECNVGKAFHSAVAAEFIERGGGHLMAGGLSFNDRQQRRLHKRLAYIFDLKQKTYQEDLRQVIDLTASASEFAPAEWAAIFEVLAPFGNGNPCPPLIVESAELLGVRPVTRTRQVSLGRREDETDEQFEAADNDNSRTKIKYRLADKENHWAIKPNEIVSHQLLIQRLRDKRDVVSNIIMTNLDAEALGALANYQPPTPEEARLPDPVLQSINRMMKQPGIFDPKHFKGIVTRLQTRHLLQQNPTNSRRVELNRYFLEDAFPAEISKLQPKPLPQAWGYRATFMDKFTRRIFFANWTDLEEAEVLWQVHRFLENQAEGGEAYRPDCCFRLQLELRAYVPSAQRSKIYQGKSFKWDYGFQVRQCVPVPREDRFPQLMRMKEFKR
jgi:single-stranded DNA-specific DHH superfamily exonuclease